MALAILDGTQTATTLSTILSSGQHITAHTVVSLGTQAITDILNATSAGLTNTQLRASAVTISGTVTVGNSLTISSLPAISGTVTANVPLSVDGYTATTGIRVIGTGVDGTLRIQGIDPTNSQPANLEEGGAIPIYSFNNNALPVSISALPAGTNRIGVVTIGAGTVTIGAGTAQIGSVTASISGTVTANLNLPSFAGGIGDILTSAVQIGYYDDGLSEFRNVNSADSPLPISGTVVIGAALPAGTNLIGTVTANLSISSTAITSGSFASLTSATLVPGNTARKMATVYNLGAGQLFVQAGASATTLGGGFMVALSSGDYFECGFTTTTLSAIFATAGTASWVSH